MFQRDPATGDFIVAGHRVPAIVVGIVIAALALVFVLRLRSKGKSVGVGPSTSPAIGTGPSPYEVYDPTTGLPVGYSQDQLAIAELSNAVNALQNELDQSGQLNAGSSTTTGSSGGSTSSSGLNFVGTTSGTIVSEGGTVSTNTASLSPSSVTFDRLAPRPV